MDGRPLRLCVCFVCFCCVCFCFACFCFACFCNPTAPPAHRTCRYHYNVANNRVQQHVEKGNDDGLYISSVACCQVGRGAGCLPACLLLTAHFAAP